MIAHEPQDERSYVPLEAYIEQGRALEALQDTAAQYKAERDALRALAILVLDDVGWRFWYHMPTELWDMAAKLLGITDPPRAGTVIPGVERARALLAGQEGSGEQ
jgi:hypothetical protein